jgi:hypothetical protein
MKSENNDRKSKTMTTYVEKSVAYTFLFPGVKQKTKPPKERASWWQVGVTVFLSASLGSAV